MTPGSRRTVALVGAALAFLIGGVVWISAVALRAARREAEAREKAAVEEGVRLALWRMDSFVAPILARAYLMWMRDRHEVSPFIKGLSGPDPASDDLATPAQRLRFDQNTLDGKVSQAQELAQKAGGDYQSFRGSQELLARTKNVRDQIVASAGLPANAPALPQPTWLGKELGLARLDAFHGVQGRPAFLDWPALKRRLEQEIADLFPSAQLEPDTTGSGERTLASLPVRLVPGPLAGPRLGAGPPVFLGLGLAWASVLLAVAAVVALLIGAVALSERRAVFVSAVTHELRTPLTTFRTYTEMLARGMVPEAARPEYLETLRREADRLAHLTENVLLYARLERGRGGHHVEEVDLGVLIERVRPRLEERARQAGMTLAIAGAEARVAGDATAIEQILFNLVDNACKYAAGADDKRIDVTVRRSDDQVIVEVSDRGPGIAAADRRRLFQPFSRSAREAAGHAPGVGLGLALSRRLARAMGGELVLGEGGGGATFRLNLPTAP